MKSKLPKHTVGSGNVFEDLGFDNPEEELAKARLAQRIASLIEARGLTQTQAAKILGLTQPKVSSLVCGRLGKFSIGKLMELLKALDQRVEIVVRDSTEGKKSLAREVVAM